MKLMEKKKLGQLLGTIGKQHATIRANIQTALVHAIGHAIVHRDTSFGLRLMQNTDGAIRRQAIVNYLGNFGPFTWVPKDEKFTFTKGWQACKPEEVEEWMDKINATLWYEYTQEAAIKAYDPLKDIESMFGRFTRNFKKASEEGKVLPHSDLFDVLQQAHDEYKLKHSSTTKDEEEKKDATNPVDPVTPKSTEPDMQEQMATNRELRAA